MTPRTMAFLAGIGLSTLACSGAQNARDYRYAGHDDATMVDVNVTQGPMPQGESYTGSFSSQQIGDVYFEQTGDSVIGTYEYNRASCRARGRIEGSVTGNLLRFNWTEDQRACGRMQLERGRGYFLFWIDSAGNGRANGQWGPGTEETGGGPWALFRDRVRRQPPRHEDGEQNGPFSDDPVNGPRPGAAPSTSTTTTP